MKIKQLKIFKIHNYYFLTCSIYILLYIFITPPFYVADEYSHFQKSASKESFYLTGPLSVDNGIKKFSDHFEELAFNKWKKNREFKYSSNLINDNKDNYKLENSLTSANLAGLSGYPFTSYFVSKIAINISKIFTNDVIKIFYLGRIANFIFCIIICWLVIKKITWGKEYLYIILSMPMTLTLFGSYNQDAILFSFTLLIIFFINKIQNQTDKVDIRLIILQIITLLLIMGRPTYLTFFLLPLFLILNYSKYKTRQLLIFFLIICLSLVFIKTYPTPAISNSVNFPNDIIKILVIISNDIYVNLFKYVALMIGGLGRIDLIVNYYLIIFICLCILYFYFFKINYKDLFSKFNIIIFLIFVSTVCLTLLSQYMYFTNTGQTKFISGVQGRYFIPIFLLLTLSINKLNNNKFNYLKKTIIFIIPHINFFVLYEYYNFFY